MTDFETQLTQFEKEAAEIQKKENQLRAESQVFHDKFQGFLKENGLTDTFTLPALAMLVARKVKA